jgi:hypothetical protein
MKLRSAPIAFAVFALLAATACNDGLTPVNPPGHPAPLGIIRGTVSGDSMTAEFIPFGSMGGSNSAVSPSIYGGPSTIAVSGTFVNFTFGVGTRTWTFNVHMRNLLSYPIGSNYASSNPAPPDTSGVFVGFTTQPFISQSTPCSGCTITVSNYGGLANFTSPSQPYFWYKSRPTAVQGAPGTDTTSNVQWKFTGTFKPLPGDTVHGFTFALMVNAAWPNPNDTAWTYNYNGKTDSLPDQVAKPRWKPPFVQTKNYNVLGTETWNAGTDLVLTAAANNNAIFIARNDSMDALKSASIELQAQLGGAIQGVPIQAIFGYVEPGVSGQMAFVGIYEDHVAFVHFNPLNGQWSDIPLRSFAVNGTLPHVYRIRKFGTLDNHLCVDHVAVIVITPAELDATASDFSTSTMVFAALGAQHSAVNLHVTNVNYQIGTDGGGC